MRDAILKVLGNSERALSVYELCDALNINTVEETKQLNEELRKLEEDATIYHSNKNKYLTLEKSHLRKGVMRTNKKGFGFVEVDGMDDDILSIRTYYEQQWLDRGLNIKYIKFRLPQEGELKEPDVEIELDDYRSYNRSKRSGLQTSK